ncbi:MAG TPA: hypothetical protein VGL02_31380, partial [Streptomyces sp.]
MLARRRELIAANPDITEARDLAPLMGDLEREYWEWCLERFLAKEDALSSGNPRTFHLQREEDVTGVSGSGRVADGVLWPDGTATVKWRGEYASEVCWLGGIDAVERVHGHDGRTIIVWHDVPAASGDTGQVTP